MTVDRSTSATATAGEPAGYDVFLSHNGDDKPAVMELAQRLRGVGIEPFFDKWHLVPGEAWQAALEKALDDSRSCAVFLGPTGFGPWENEEMRVALSRRVSNHEYRVIPVLLPGAVLPSRGKLPRFLSQVTWVDFRPGLDDADAFDRLVAGIRGVAPETGAEEIDEDARGDDIVSPFRGLESFDEVHAEFFFGREGLTQHLVEQLRDDRFLAVLGPSGSGKSSVVKAGLIPALRHGALPGSADWKVVIVRPGANPMEALATRLVELVGPGGDALGTRASILETLERDERGLHTIVGLATDGHDSSDRAVIVVDQFEEIFTHVHGTGEPAHDDAEQAAFVGSLLYASSVVGGRTVVIVTMRADFFGKCAAIPGLAARLSERDVLVAPMDEPELRRAIVLPAEKVGLQFEKGLVDTILEDLRGEPGSLPLLQHALLELFEGRRGRWLTIDRYREIGGVRGAIASRAEAVFGRLSPEEQAATRRVLLRLTQPGEGTDATRRRASMAELTSSGHDAQAMEAVVNDLAVARLVTTSRDEGGDDVVDVAHEALIRNWPRLRQWVSENPTALRIHRDLTRAAETWEHNRRDRSYLYGGPRLDESLAFASRNPDDLNELEQSFLRSSRRARQSRTIRLVAVMAVASLVFAAIGVVAIIQAQLADQSTMRAEQAAGEAATNALLSDSTALAREAPAAGLRLATEAMVRGASLGMDLDRLTTNASAMLDSGRYASLPTFMQQAWTDPGGRIIVGGPADEPAAVYATSDGRRLAELPGAIESVTFPGGANGGVFVVVYDDFADELRRIDDGSPVPLAAGEAAIIADPDGTSSSLLVEYASGDEDDAPEPPPTEVRSAADGRVIRKLGGPGSVSLLGPADERLAVVDDGDGPLAVIRLDDSGAEIARIDLPADAEFGLAEITTGQAPRSFAATIGDRCTLWSVEPVRSVEAEGPCFLSEFGSDGRTVAFWADEIERSGYDIFDVESMTRLGRITSDLDLIGLSPGPSATTAVLADTVFPGDGTVTGTGEESPPRTDVADIASGRIVATIPEGVLTDDDGEPRLRFSPDGSLVILALGSGPVLVDVATGTVEELAESSVIPTEVGPLEPGGLESIRFSADGEWLLLGSVDREEVRHSFGGELRRVDDPHSVVANVSSPWWPGLTPPLFVEVDGLTSYDAAGEPTLIHPVGSDVESPVVLAFDDATDASTAVVSFETYEGTPSATSLLARDGTLTPLGGDAVKAAFSPGPSPRYVVLTEKSGRAAIWSIGPKPVELASFSGLANLTWDPNGRRVETTLTSGESYLVDLAWLEAIHAPDRSSDVSWLERLVCDGPARQLVDDAALAERIGEEPRSCRGR